MSPRFLLSMCLVVLLITACGGDDDSSDNGNGNGGENTPAAATGSTPTPQAASSNDSSSGDLEVNADYLQGEWCSVREGEDEGTTYIFDGNSFEYGRDGKLSSGGNIPTFLIGVRVASVEEDEFVARVFGREVVYTRGGCS